MIANNIAVSSASLQCDFNGQHNCGYMSKLKDGQWKKLSHINQMMYLQDANGIFYNMMAQGI